MNLLAGLFFGLVVGGIMRAPGEAYVVAASAINLAVMTALWLGIALAPGQERRALNLEIGIAGVTFVVTALVFQHSALWLYGGFALQAGWSALHIGNRMGAVSLPWYPGFAAMANLGFIAAIYAIWTFL